MDATRALKSPTPPNSFSTRYLDEAPTQGRGWWRRTEEPDGNAEGEDYLLEGVVFAPHGQAVERGR